MSSGFNEFIADLLSPWGAVTFRKMFGGYGVYHAGQIFAIIVDDELYFKVGDHNRDDYIAHDMAPFQYQAKGKDVTMSYWQVPVDLLDDGDELCRWAEKAYSAAI